MKKLLIAITGIAGQFFTGPFSMAQGIYNNASLVAAGAVQINVQDGGFYNNGSFIPPTSSFLITGNTATRVSTIGGIYPTAFYHLSISKNSNDAVLANNIMVNGNLTMIQGNLLLAGFTIDLGTGAGTVVNERNNAAIKGTSGGSVIKTVHLNAPVAVNPGNLGMVISSPADLGITTVQRGHQQQMITSTLRSIGRYYDIIPANDVSLTASLQMFYLDAEVAGADKTALSFFKSDDGGTTFSFAGKDNSNAAANWVLKNNIDKLSRWTLAATSSALPVKLVSFTARAVDHSTALQWVTAQEINSSGFTVQRSADGLSFNAVLQLPAKGNSSTPTNYTATDAHPLAGRNYYRLLETDLDGQTSLFPVVTVNFIAGAEWTVFPNPVVSTATIAINVPAAKPLTVALYDAHGQWLEQKQWQLPAGSSVLAWDMGRLAKGVYFLEATTGELPLLRIIHQ